ncbi:piggyBac transposable element-derived protein 4-like [Spodoptera frugiperda]|uniref:PiggyBac transposable element-derived protein 4-like n=1 Tax=Spodoptera frugiperda TaxID=7108 RepID=A0A9R0EXF9_SPOFR|nr:piggyBac transposable element-derived protein 4-like [Spodoptera frugiperda]
MDQPSTSKQTIEDMLGAMASPRECITVPGEFSLTDRDLFNILDEGTYPEVHDEWIDIIEEEVVTTEVIDTQQAGVEASSIWIPGNPTELNTFLFTGNPGIKQAMSGRQPINYFNLVFNMDFYTLLLICTNRNGEIIKRNASGPHARFRRWQPVTIEEFKVFLGLIMLMGVIKLNRLSDYWKKHYLFDLTFTKYMSRNRFFMILRALNVQMEAGNQSLNKVKALIDLFNKTMEDLYYPAREVTIDESMILWTGRLHFRQYLKNKVHKYGIKLYMLAEKHGICMKIHLYAGSQDQVVGGKDHVKKVMRVLMSNYVHKGHSLYVDNYYSSVGMAEEFLNKNTYITGTLQFNRKGNPVQVINTRLQPNEACIMHNSNNVTVTKWRDKREISFVSTEHNSEYIQTQNKYGNISFKPKVQVKYNKYMRAVDKHDQMLSYYCAEHKTLRWYKKVIIHVIQINIINAFLMFNLDRETKISLYDFRLQMIEFLLPKKPSVERHSVPGRVHVPDHLPKTGGKKLGKDVGSVIIQQKKSASLFWLPRLPRPSWVKSGELF